MYDSKVLQNEARGPERIEKMLGIHWDVCSDTVVALPRYNLFGSSHGKELGRLLKNMSD
jgi:hypothetical protein